MEVGCHGRCHRLLWHRYSSNHGGWSSYAGYDRHMGDLTLAASQVCTAGYTELLVCSIL